VFYPDVAKVDLVLHILQSDPSARGHLMQLLGPAACVWVWRGRHGVSAGHIASRDTKHARDMVQCKSPHEAGVGVRTLPPSGCPGARRFGYLYEATTIIL
jgi:hypothetical protein